jgi:hypothetical protein
MRSLRRAATAAEEVYEPLSPCSVVPREKVAYSTLHGVSSHVTTATHIQKAFQGTGGVQAPDIRDHLAAEAGNAHRGHCRQSTGGAYKVKHEQQAECIPRRPSEADRASMRVPKASGILERH